MFAVIRHGAHHVYPDHLTKEGESAILLLANSLAEMGPWTTLKSSSRLRTRETAEIIGRVLSLRVELDSDLLEAADPDEWMPPNVPNGVIVVTHSPVIHTLAKAWADKLSVPNPGRLEVGEGLIVDGVNLVMKKLSTPSQTVE